MTHTPYPRPLSSATGDVQTKVAQRQRRSADQDLGFRIRNDLDRALPAYSISAKHVTVLSALISFLSDQTRVVFASNRTLSMRLHNLPERTLSRQLKLLVEEGFVRRIMSPNGKRWARRKGGGSLEAFGLDLTPFFDRAQEFADRAAEARRREAEIEDARLRLSLLRERLEALGAAPELVDEIRRERRRVPCPATLERLQHGAEAELAVLGQSVDNSTQTSSEAEEMACNDSQNGWHLQTRNDRILSPANPQATQNADQIEEKVPESGGSEREDYPLPPPVKRPAEPTAAPLAVKSAPSGASFVVGRPYEEPERSKDAPVENCRDGSGLTSRAAMADYVQSVLGGFRSKLQTPTRTPSDVRHITGTTAEPSTAGPRWPSGPALPYSESSFGPDRDHPNVLRAGRSSEPTRSSRCLNATALPSLEAVLAACPESLSLVGERPRTWSELFEAAWRLGRCMQIADQALAWACSRLGREGLSVTLFCLCERHATVRQPAAYLRSLCSRSGFDPTELLRTGPTQASA